MRRLFLTYFSFFVFTTTNLLVHRGTHDVSLVTSAKEYREMFFVKQKSSFDSQIAVSLVPPITGIPNRKKFANHVRNLRVFIAPNVSEGGELSLYLEQAKPHQFYAIYGSFMIATDTKITWDGPAAFSFYATGTDSTLRLYTIDVSAPSLALK